MPEHNDIQPAAQVLRQLATITIVAGFLLAVGAVLILTVELILWSLLQNNQRTIVMLGQKVDLLNVASAFTASEVNVNAPFRQQR